MGVIPVRTARSTRATSSRYLLVLWLVAGAIMAALVGAGLTRTAPPPGITEPGVAVEIGLPLVRVVLDIAALATVGLNLLPLLIGVDRLKQTEEPLARARAIAVCTAALWGVAALTTLALQTSDYDPTHQLNTGLIWQYIHNNGAGQALLIVAASALLQTVLGVFAVRRGEAIPAELRSVLALFTLLPLPVTGHAASTAALRDVGMISMELHVVGAMTWTGGLLAVIGLIGSRRALLATTLPRFSRLATLCIALAVVTGVFNAWLELHLVPGVPWYQMLFTTGYGIMVLGKIGCAAVLAVLGSTIRMRVLPLVVRHQRTGLITWAAFELAVMGLAFGFAVVLTHAPVVT